MMLTLAGRWQTRIVLFLAIGLPVSLVFALAQGDDWVPAPEPFVLVAAMLCLGLGLDLLYHQLQRFRWDQDWPFALYALVSTIEFATILIAARSDGLPWIDACHLARIDRLTRQLVCVDYAIPVGTATAQFVVILALSLMFVAGIGQAIFIDWRFRGGEFGGFGVSDK